MDSQVQAAQDDVYNFVEKYIKENLSFQDAPEKIDKIVKHCSKVIMLASRGGSLAGSPEADLAEIRTYLRLKFTSSIKLPMDDFIAGFCTLISEIIRRIVILLFENSIFVHQGCLSTGINEHVLPFLTVLLNDIMTQDRIIDLSHTLYTCIHAVMNISSCTCISNERMKKVITITFQDHCEPFIISLADAHEAAILIQRTWRRACSSPFMAICKNRIKKEC